MQNRLRNVIILRNERLTENAYYLSFRRDFDFVPGQVIGITLDPEIPPRLYSIASGSQQSDIEILYTIKKGGELTPKLSEARPGDNIWITGPEGSFRHSASPSWWIASGTGIAPFLSWIRSGMLAPHSLIFGARERESLYFDHDLQSIAGTQYHRCCSIKPSPDCFHGRVTDYIESLDVVDPSILYFVCGVAEMVVDTREVLIGKGVEPRLIYAEIYF